jgi:hypothetical protein
LCVDDEAAGLARCVVRFYQVLAIKF